MKKPSLGVDIEEIKRFESLIRDRRFLNRVFSKREITYCQSHKNKAQHFAVRFAAKEAVWKAVSEDLTRLKKKLTHKDISIKNAPSGKPEVVLPKRLENIRKKLSISLSHSRVQAIAVALYQR